jgi:hypothetical protein
VFANALLAATAVFLALLFFIMGQLRFLTPWRDLILRNYWPAIAMYSGLLFLNVIAGVVFIQRKFLLKDAGRKLVHLDRQIQTGQHELSKEFAELTSEEEWGMSRTDDYRPADNDPRDGNSPTIDRTAEINSRMGISREAAHAEMERFHGVAEYEIRKLFGQRSAMRQPVVPEVPAAPEVEDKPSRKKKTAGEQRPFRPRQESTQEVSTKPSYDEPLHDDPTPRRADDTIPQQSDLFALGPEDND